MKENNFFDMFNPDMFKAIPHNCKTEKNVV